MAGRAREGQGPVVQHGHRRRSVPLLPQLARRPEHSVRVTDRAHRRAAAPASGSSARPRRSSASATGWLRSTEPCSTRTPAQPFNDLLGLSRTVFPYVEEHKFFCDYWFLTRWWNKIREFGALLARTTSSRTARTCSSCRATRWPRARRARADVGDRRRCRSAPQHWPPIVARRKEILARLGEWTPPPASASRPRRSPIR